MANLQCSLLCAARCMTACTCHYACTVKAESNEVLDMADQGTVGECWANKYVCFSCACLKYMLSSIFDDIKRSYKTHVIIGEAFRAKCRHKSVLGRSDFRYTNTFNGK